MWDGVGGQGLGALGRAWWTRVKRTRWSRWRWGEPLRVASLFALHVLHVNTQRYAVSFTSAGTATPLPWFADTHLRRISMERTPLLDLKSDMPLIMCQDCVNPVNPPALLNPLTLSSCSETQWTETSIDRQLIQRDLILRHCLRTHLLWPFHSCFTCVLYWFRLLYCTTTKAPLARINCGVDVKSSAGMAAVDSPSLLKWDLKCDNILHLIIKSADP